MYYIVCKNIYGIILSNSKCKKCIELEHKCTITHISTIDKNEIELYTKNALSFLETTCRCNNTSINNEEKQVHKKVL